MFWGLILEPERRYSQIVKKPFRVTMASLDVISSKEEPTQVIVTFQNKNFLACTLKKDGLLNQPLDLRFQEGDQISFAANGNSHVHLTGYLMDMEDDFDLEGEESEDEANKVTMKKRRNEQNDAPPSKKSKTLELLENAEESDSDDSDFSLSKIPVPFSDEDESGDDEEDDVEEEEEEDDDEDDEEGDDDEDEEADELELEFEEDESEDEDDEEDEVKEINIKPSKGQKKKDKKQASKDVKNNSVQSEKSKQNDKKQNESQKNGSPAKKRTIEGGVSIEELKVGNGPIAKAGKFVNVYYEGRLKSNNKMFDSATKGAGFQFRLGRQEVIKGWDVGVSGMKVGGKRRIICPPNMAYGAKGSPPAIPPNSTLVFDVELKKVK
ncbi:46 kDa FK506-binding nuclear protein [Onthophagus taurus]|uniref:46 kDa FK506-binding nuclear protein n=1 Tax=Onthophagus taurus TaxID=166361 RepID=UPI000C20AA6B|nr:46 kDa FK506-binding nuclear protein [Onthophagus taurus]